MDSSLDQGLSALSQAITRRLGRGPVDDLAENPDSIRARQRVAAVERAADADERFARELADLREQLDRASGQYTLHNSGRHARMVEHRIGPRPASGSAAPSRPLVGRS